MICPMKTLPFGRSNMAAICIFRLLCLRLTKPMPQTVTAECFCLPRAETWPQTGVECVCHFAHFAGDWWGWGGLPSQITGCCPKSAAHCRMAPGRKIRRAAEYTRHPWCFINGCWYQPPLSISGSSVLGFQDLHKGIVVILICQKC